MRIISCVLLLAGMAFNLQSFSMTYYMTPALSTTLKFPPGESQTLINYFLWTVKATCRMKSINDHNDVLIEVINNKAKINEIELEKGDSMILTVRNGDVMKITAVPQAKIQLVNQGTETIRAICSM